MAGRERAGALLVAACAAWIAEPARAIEFEFISSDRTPPSIIDAFTAAGQLWTAAFSDPIRVRIDLDYGTLPAGWLAETVPQTERVDYSTVRSWLVADQTSASDVMAVAGLQAGPAFNMLLNRTPTSPTTPYLDDNGNLNNRSIRTTTANLKALGKTYAADLADARITVSSAARWDYDPADGITAGFFDLVGIAAHEIGHVLGFSSGVDLLDTYGSVLLDSQWTYVTTMDLFRFSADSVTHGLGVIDFTADARAKYFSIDGGMTPVAAFATGAILGDGHQASHWGPNLGIMSARVQAGQRLEITSLDRLLFDVIGYDLRRDGPALVVKIGQQVALDDSTQVLEGLTIIEHGRLDIGRGALLVRTEDPQAMLDQITRWIASARNGGDELWQGWGLLSTWAAADPHMTLAAILNRDADGAALHELFGGQPAQAGDVLVRATWIGDLDLNGTIDWRDLARLENGLLGRGFGYAHGDVNYDGIINGDDCYLIDQAYLAQVMRMEAGLGLAAMAVPEPACLGVLAAAGLLLQRRRHTLRQPRIPAD